MKDVKAALKENTVLAAEYIIVNETKILLILNTLIQRLLPSIRQNT